MNIRGNDDARRCRYFLQRKDGFLSPSASQTVVNKPMRIRKKEIKAMLAQTNPLSRFLFLSFEAGPIYHDDTHSRRRDLKDNPEA